MRPQRPNELGKSIERFFREYLPTLRGTSRHTIRNYRDAIVLFLRFTSIQTERAIEDLDLADFTARRFEASWLSSRPSVTMASPPAMLGSQRCTHSPAFSRPSSLHTWPSCSACWGCRSNVARVASRSSTSSRQEVEALLNSIDRATPAGKRDYALFARVARSSS